MKIACCIWALPEDDRLHHVRRLGFEWIDIQPQMLQSAASQKLAKRLGLGVSCVGASFGMPAALDDIDDKARQQAVGYVMQAIDHAARLNADTVYVVPGMDCGAAALERYSDSLCALAERAQAEGIKLAIEHFPGRALSTARETLAFIRRAGHANLYLLYDSGHIQICGEDAAAVIEEADARLGYVHFDDNDGKDDLHWSLLDGVMTAETLAKTLRALERIGYAGALSLELHSNLPDVPDALARSRDILLQAGSLR